MIVIWIMFVSFMCEKSINPIPVKNIFIELWTALAIHNGNQNTDFLII